MLAKAVWDVTCQHLISQQKAYLCVMHLEELKANSVMPVKLFGAEPLRCYYATDDGKLSEASEKADQVLKELKAQAVKENRNATYFGLTK